MISVYTINNIPAIETAEKLYFKHRPYQLHGDLNEEDHDKAKSRAIGKVDSQLINCSESEKEYLLKVKEEVLKIDLYV